MICYRLYPKRYAFLCRLLRIAFGISVCSTTLETAIVGWFYGALFHRWSRLNKTMTPILFITFLAAQIWSAKCLWEIGSKQGRMARGKEDIEGDAVELTAMSKEGTDKERPE